jgi:acyl carrier protein
MPDVMVRLRQVIHETFFTSRVPISRETTADDVEGWDSLTHVRLLLTIEKTFGIKFRLLEATRLANVGELCDLIEAKQADTGGSHD